MLPEPPRCVFPGCSEWADHRHHVTYIPEVMKLLCFAHHEQITMLHGQQSRKYNYRKLSNNHRWWIWYQWIGGKLKPRRTRKALEWTESWTARPEMHFEQEERKAPVSTAPIVKRKARKGRRSQAKKGKRRKIVSARRKKRSKRIR